MLLLMSVSLNSYTQENAFKVSPLISVERQFLQRFFYDSDVFRIAPQVVCDGGITNLLSREVLGYE